MNDAQITQEILNEAINELETINDWLRFSASQFSEAGLFFGHGTDNAWDEAVSLILPALFLPMDMPRDVISSKLVTSEKQKLAQLLEARINQRTPVPYLTNQAWFAKLPFYVDERVLIPRSPFAELIHNRFSTWLEDDKPVSRILDMCTGSACIAIALAKEFTNSQVDAVDISYEALEVADFNIHEHLVSDRVFPIQSDVFSGVPGQKYDLIIANPPYVDAEDMADLPDEFHHEPELGLASGDDGLDVTRTILAQAADHLTDHGLLFVEVGNSMVHMEAIYPNLPFTWLEFENGGIGVFVLSKEDLVKHI
ncbi:50S ribosomal protein L3 N(5)-glutamine methyltransferase [Pseudoalteromonas denitrificans]|nr:50S ribosomal protein L3 N(5)-glutamine methyltransferase [Pseudoalteromonas denitrificans]